MAYCRFIEADAYIYDDIRHGIICCACTMGVLELENFIAGYDYDLMLEHIAEHRKQNDHIPYSVDEQLIFERDCIHEFNSEKICNHCWRRKSL